jgi:hypothetical protein
MQQQLLYPLQWPGFEQFYLVLFVSHHLSLSVLLDNHLCCLMVRKLCLSCALCLSVVNTIRNMNLLVFSGL